MDALIVHCIKNKIKESPELVNELYSLILYGSAVRGDFIKGISDLDFLPL